MMMLNPSWLPRTRDKKRVPWRESRFAVLLVRADGGVGQSQLLAENRRLAAECGANDRLLAVWMQRFHPLVLWVDDLDAPRAALVDR